MGTSAEQRLQSVPPAMVPVIELLAMAFVKAEKQATRTQTALLNERSDIRRLEETELRLAARLAGIHDAYRTLLKLPESAELGENTMISLRIELHEIAATAGSIAYQAAPTED